MARSNIRRNKSQPKSESRGRGREVAGIFMLGFGVFSVISLVCRNLDVSSLMGPGGEATAAALYSLAGFASYLLVTGLLVVAVRCFRGRSISPGIAEAAGALGIVASLAVLMHLPFSGEATASNGPGGLMGQWLAELVGTFIGSIGAGLAAVTLFTVCLTLVTPLRMDQIGALLSHIAHGIYAAAAEAVAAFGRLISEMFPEKDASEEDEYEEEEEDEYEADADEDVQKSARSSKPAGTRPRIYEKTLVGLSAKDAQAASLFADEELENDDEDAVIVGEAHRSLAVVADGSDNTDENEDEDLAAALQRPGRRDIIAEIAAADAAAGGGTSADPAYEPPRLNTGDTPIIRSVTQPALELAAGAAAAANNARSGAADGQAPLIVDSEDIIPAKKSGVPGFIRLSDGDYKLPDIHRLDYEPPKREALDEQELYDMAERLEQAMANYGVKGKVKEIHLGPVVTMYEFAPAPGTRTGRIANMEKDLAMALEAQAVRIVAPIPGKAVVGVEVPNKVREMVYLREILEDSCFVRENKLQVALGKDIKGAPVCLNLTKMPHLLVAGTTGSGKSVAVNSMITSILHNSTPEEVRFIMVDPKMLELSIYEGIPHLLLPVVTDPTKANLALKWAVEEMERRYELLAKSGVRDISTYNTRLERSQKEDADHEAALAAAAGEELTVINAEEGAHAEGEAPPEKPRKLPLIVIVIDEFADLMMVAAKEVETSVARIAQKARAAGIHLILATQRPSVDVITGLIKANFPSRLALQVASRIDSRTILDQAGAETLLGHGDMLFSSGGRLRRIHGAFLSDDEVHNVVNFLKKQAKPVYDMDIIKPRDEEGGEGDAADDLPADPLYDRAIGIVCETRQASVSFIQRRLGIGYNRSARMVEKMERDGIVGPAQGMKPREVMAPPGEYLSAAS